MPKRITYLLGAGASANTIPVVSNINKRVEEVIKELEKYRNISDFKDQRRDLLLPNIKKNTIELAIKKYELSIGLIIAYLEQLKLGAGKNFTIDTLAKKYFLKGQYTELRELKKSLVIYFTLEQFLFFKSENNKETGYSFKKDETDKRYDSFFAAIAKRENEKLVLNKDISVLSWNYDIQIELSLKNYSEGSNNLNFLKRHYNIHPNPSLSNSFDRHSFSVIKLNGSAILEENPGGPSTPKSIFDIPLPQQTINLVTPEETEFLSRLGMYVDYFEDALIGNRAKITALPDVPQSSRTHR